MKVLILVRRHALAGLSGLVLLGGCGHPSSAVSGSTLTPSVIIDRQATQTALSLSPGPSPAAATTTPPPFPPTVLTITLPSPSPTATSPSPSPTMPTATRAPSRTPGPWSSPTPDPYDPPLVKALPLDQHWLLAPEGSTTPGCRGVTLFSIARSGSISQLDEQISSIVPRPGKPPLLMTCPAPEGQVIIDPLDGSRFSLIPDPVWGLPRGTGTLSPQGDEIVVQMALVNGMGPHISIVVFNLATGKSRVLYPALDDREPPPFYMDEFSGIVGWRNEGIYLVASNGLWRIDPTHPDSPPVHLVPDYEYANICSLPAMGDHIACGGLYNLRTGAETMLPGANRGEASLAPDGTKLVYTRQGGVGLYDLRSGQEQILETGALLFQRSAPSLRSPLRWSDDGQRIILLATSEAVDKHGNNVFPNLISEALIFTANGELLASARFPLDAHRSVTLMPSDELLVVQAESHELYMRNPNRSTPERGPWRGERLVLRWVDPGLGTPPHAHPVVVLPDTLEDHGVAVSRVRIVHSP